MANLDERGQWHRPFRTEILFMVAPRCRVRRRRKRSIARSSILPGVACHLPHARYRGRQGAAYLKQLEEENPALGWARCASGLIGLRFSARNCVPLLAAAKDRDLKIMLPMVSVVEELDAAKAMLGRERERQRRLGQPGPKTGATRRDARSALAAFRPRPRV